MVLLLASATDLELISITCTSLGDDERAAAAVGKTLSVARVRQRLAKALCVPWLFEAAIPNGRRIHDCPNDLPSVQLAA